MVTRVFLRGDGNESIGLGHISRLLAIVDALNNCFELIFLNRKLSDFARKLIDAENIRRIEIPDDELRYFEENITGEDVLVIDGYHIKEGHRRKIKELGIKLVLIDDLKEGHFFADVVINHAWGIRSDDYSVEKYTKLCVGTEYLLLRKCFFETRQSDPTRGRVFVCLGGADPLKLIETFFNSLLEISEITEIIVISPHAERLKGNKSMMSYEGNIQIFDILDQSDMISMLKTSSLAIVSASNMLLECIALNIPVMAGYYVDNQYHVYAKGKLLSTFFPLGRFQELEHEFFKSKVRAALSTHPNEVQKKAQKSACDGNSHMRILEIFKNI